MAGENCLNKMIRIFAQWQNQVILTDDDAHHLVRVLRVQVGEMIELLISETVYEGRVVSLHPLVIERGQAIISNHELPFLLTLIYPLAKGERLDWVVQKATELGVHELIACESERTIVHWELASVSNKLLRYQRMIKEATLQSKREKMMIMTRYLPLYDAFKLPFDRRYLASEHHLHQAKHLLDIPPILQGERIAIAVGPEGGFSPDEVTQAGLQGYEPISLGKSILRTETAVTVALGILSQKGGQPR